MQVLILEDEPLIAMSMQMLVEDQGWAVLGPYATIEDALKALAGGAAPDCGLLDLNLHGKASWPVADVLAERGISFAFTSGQTRGEIEARFVGRPTFSKPIEDGQVKRFLAGVAAKAAV